MLFRSQEAKKENTPSTYTNSIPHHLNKARRGSNGGKAPALAMVQSRATTTPPGNKGGDVVMSEAKGILKRVRSSTESTKGGDEVEPSQTMPASTTTTPEITTNKVHTPKSNALPPSTAHTHTPTTAQRTNQRLDLADEQNQEQTPVFEERNEAPTPRGTKVAPEERGE